jgi:hypothetical protein
MVPSKNAKERSSVEPSTRGVRREQQDGREYEVQPALQRTSRSRLEDENDERGHAYRTARYLTRFD